MSKLTTIEVPVAPVEPPNMALDLSALKYAVMISGPGNRVTALFRWLDRAVAYRNQRAPGNRIINIETGKVL